MRPDQGERQELDLLEERLETAVLRDPCTDLREQVAGDINGARRAALFEGDVLAAVQRSPAVTAAGGPPTAVGVRGERGREGQRGAGQLLEAAVEHTADEGGVVGNAQGGTSLRRGAVNRRIEV